MPKSIGIIGGLGPAATAYFRQRLIQRAQQQFGAHEDWEYPAIYEVTVQDREFTHKGEYCEDRTYGVLVTAIAQLESLGADLIAIPCNTAHMEIDSLQEHCVRARIVNMLAEAGVMAGRDTRTQAFVVLASRTARDATIFDHYIPADRLLYPTDLLQDKIDEAIHLLMKGKSADWLIQQAYYGVAVMNKEFRQDRLRPLIACTELSMSNALAKTGLPLDTLDALVYGCLKEAYS